VAFITILFTVKSVWVQEVVEQVQAVVGSILSRLCANPLHGPRILLLLGRLLPPGHVTAIHVRPISTARYF